MPNDRPEFRPIEVSSPKRSVWPFAVMGAIIAGLLVFILRHETASAKEPEKTVAMATVAASKVDTLTPKIEPLVAPEVAKPKADTSVIGSAAATVSKLATVAKAEFDREVNRTKSAQKQNEIYKKQIADLEKQLGDARAQLAAIAKAHAPPPPSDQEQILQMLAPVLRTSNDGRP